jgi:hypothetical protein
VNIRVITQLREQFNVLIAEAERIKKMVKTTSQTSNGGWMGQQTETSTFEEWPEVEPKIWRANFTTLMETTIPTESLHWDHIKRVANSPNSRWIITEGLPLLIAIRADIDAGLMRKLSDRIDSEVTADFLGMAENLLTEGTTGQHDHIAAAVIGGAILERAMRSLCGRQTPPIPTFEIKNGKEDPKTMNPLIDTLKRAGVLPELKAKQLRAWADIRNAAAHGEFQKIQRNDVEIMLKGITQFLGDYLC